MNSTSTFGNVLIVILCATLSVAATVAIVGTAQASFGAIMTVRITDRSAVEAELGRCESGFQIRNELDGGSMLIPLRNGQATITSRYDGMVAAGWYCAGVPVGYPTSGVAIELR